MEADQTLCARRVLYSLHHVSINTFASNNVSIITYCMLIKYGKKLDFFSPPFYNKGLIKCNFYSLITCRSDFNTTLIIFPPFCLSNVKFMHRKFKVGGLTARQSKKWGGNPPKKNKFFVGGLPPP